MARRSGPALYELLGSARAAKDGAPATIRASEPMRPDPMQLRMMVIVMVAIAAVVVAYLVGSAGGERLGRARLLAEQEEEARIAAAARPAVPSPASGNPASSGAPAGPLSGFDGRQPPSGGAPSPPAGALPPAEPGVDPRQAGLNYYVLASTLEENAAKVVAFCRARGLDAYVVRDHNGRLREVTVLPGFRESERDSAVINALEERIREVGRQFKASGPGNSDFGDRYSKLFKG